VRKRFEVRYDLDRKTLLEKVYRQKQPALFLSSFTEFYIDNRADNYLKSVIINGFNKLINTYLLPLSNQHPGAQLHFAGSVAANFQDYLYEATAESNLTITSIIKEPINNLLTYYSNKN